MREKQPLDDIALPSPLTSRNLRPRRFPPMSATTTMHPTNALAGPSSSSSRSHKRGRERSGSSDGFGMVSKRARRTTYDDQEDEEEIDELQDDDDGNLVPPDADARAIDTSAEAQEDEVEAILRPGARDGEDDIQHGQGGESPKRAPVSSPSLARILQSEDEGNYSLNPTSATTTAPDGDKKRSQSPQLIIDSPTEFTIASTSKLRRMSPPSSSSLPISIPSSSSSSAPPARTKSSRNDLNASSRASDLEPLSAYTCPICFFPPTNATLTPCGHVCCGACLFTAVKTMLQRAGPSVGTKDGGPRCPVCRAPIPGWDGHGGGVIGLKVRAVLSL
ncbi:hypothetical protein B0H12DRAFT_1132624 [Mycena haematopus]|nr:hypothetical protein B0H12DRAFT_1132624 [Mycena haematopus]